MSDNDEAGVYCICRSTDTSRFMIGCDNCNEWYHGDCISITETLAKNIVKFICLICRARNPSLESVISTDKSNTRRKPGCGDCNGCLRTQDCGKCEGCNDGRPCRKRICRVERKRKEERREKRRREEEAEAERRRLEELEKEKERKRREKEKKKLELEQKRDRYHNDDEYIPPEINRATKRNTRRKQEPAREPAKRSRKRDDNDDELFTSKVSEPKQCYGPACIQTARPNSKYCSDDCGMKLAMSRIFVILPERNHYWQKKDSEAELANKRSLQKIRQQIREAELEELENRRKKEALETLIRRGKEQTIGGDDFDEGEDQEPIYCVTCGQDYSTKVIFRHMEKCFNRHESASSYGSAYPTKNDLVDMFCEYYSPSQQTYCKRLKILCPEHYKEPKVLDTEVCGFPMQKKLFDDSEVDFCRVAKKKCIKHVSWERLKRAQVDNEIIRSRLKREDLMEQERIIHMQMTSRGGVLGLMLHNTIENVDDLDESNDYSKEDDQEMDQAPGKAEIEVRHTTYDGDHDYGFKA